MMMMMMSEECKKVSLEQTHEDVHFLLLVFLKDGKKFFFSFEIFHREIEREGGGHGEDDEKPFLRCGLVVLKDVSGGDNYFIA